MRHEKSLHVIEGRRAAKEHQLELERRAAAAAHEASFAGLMNPFDWAVDDLGDPAPAQAPASSAGSAGSSGSRVSGGTTLIRTLFLLPGGRPRPRFTGVGSSSCVGGISSASSILQKMEKKRFTRTRPE